MIYLTLKRSINPNEVDYDGNYKNLEFGLDQVFNPFNKWYVTSSLSLAGAILDVFIPGDQF